MGFTRMLQVGLFFWCLIGLSSFGGRAQSSGDAIAEEGKVRTEALADKLFGRVNELRVKKKVVGLSRCSSLDSAALDHARHLARKGKLTHYQKGDPEMRTPQDRILYYGGEWDDTSENVLFIPFREGMNDQSAVREMFRTWRRSSQHYGNMVQGDFRCSGIAVVYSEKEEKLFAVQTFAVGDRK